MATPVLKWDKPFYTLREAWELKGSIGSYDTFRRYRYIQPKSDFKIGGIRVFTKETIIEWITLTDADMEAYNRKYKTGAKRHQSRGRPKKKTA